MTQAVRFLMLFEAVTFIVASLVHSGVSIEGYQHPEARSEGVIAIVLLAGAALTWVRPTWTRGAGLVTQGLALIGALIGVFTNAIGTGPRTLPDIAYYLAIVAVLALGLSLASWARPARGSE
jgi:hypothetical protein